MIELTKTFKAETIGEIRKRKIKEYFTKKSKAASDWISEHSDTVSEVVIVVLLGGSALVSQLHKSAVLRKEDRLKNLYCYDRSLGHYWRLRRELTNSEWIEIDRRKRNGERLADILDELRVLK